MADKGYVRLSHDIKLDPDVTPSHGKVRLGGFFAISYTKAYTAAWQRLLSSSRQLAIPILYLQRHTLELVVKDILESLLNAREEMEMCRDVFGPESQDDPGDMKEWAEDMKLVNVCHTFDDLLECLERNRKILGLLDLPQDFYSAKALLDHIEDGDPTRLRYSTVRGAGWTRKKPRMVSSFEGSFRAEPKIADLDALSPVLSRIVCVHHALSDPAGPNQKASSFIDHVWMCEQYKRSRIASRLHQLDTATRAGLIVWKETTEPRLIIKGHTDFDDTAFRDSMYSEYLFTEHEGRRYVILGFRANGSRKGSQEMSFMFTHQRSDGTLSRLLFADDYESNIIRSALRSWQGLPNDLPLPSGNQG